MRNVQLAEICRKVPRTLEALKQIEGVGEATVSRYGGELLAQIPPELQAEPPGELAAEPAPDKEPQK
jgi:superfamily II DNA helicase RecQ